MLLRQTASLRKGNEKGFKPKALRKANTAFPNIKKLLQRGKKPHPTMISLEASLKKAILLMKIQRKLIHF